MARTAPRFARHRWLLPSAVVAELDPDAERPGRPPRRTARDWVVDFTCFLLAIVIGLAVAESLTDKRDLPEVVVAADQLLGALACAAVWLRRRRPLGLAVATLPLAFVSTTSAGACTVALFTLAVHRPFRYVAWVGGIQQIGRASCRERVL